MTEKTANSSPTAPPTGLPVTPASIMASVLATAEALNGVDRALLKVLSDHILKVGAPKDAVERAVSDIERLAVARAAETKHA